MITMNYQLLVVFCLCLSVVLGVNQTKTINDDLPTLYEYYTEGGITSGLDDTAGTTFKLNGKDIKIFSGALHYFRVPQEYWRDRLRKYRAAGLIAVETYIPWNLHEYQNGYFDFGYGGSEFSSYLDVQRFIETAQEEDLLVIIRPGPYICAEFEFGGLPSWLLRYDGIRMRSSDETFIWHVRRFYEKLFEILSPLHFTRGGPIIAFQIENEYGQTGEPIDKVYLETLKSIMEENGAPGLFFTADPPHVGFIGTLPGVLATINTQTELTAALTALREYQPNKPLMVMEYWTGWFDNWADEHHTIAPQVFADILDEILGLDSSFNLYMMTGGTNWGFLNGGSIDDTGYAPTITSYDYDSPLSESGRYTEKYWKLIEVLEKYTTVQLKKPDVPDDVTIITYPEIQIHSEIWMTDLINQGEHWIESETTIPMEYLDINNDSGQSHGYIVYQKKNLDIPAHATFTIEGRVCDSVMVLVNGELYSKILRQKSDLDDFGYWRVNNSYFSFGNSEAIQGATFDLVVENWGKLNTASMPDLHLQLKGLWQGNIWLNDQMLTDWTIVPLEFKQDWTNSLTGWTDFTNTSGPKLYKANLFLAQEPQDTYIDMRDWTKGIVIVNNFVLARHLFLGPQLFAYLPATLLRQGINDICIFEHFVPSTSIKFTNTPIFIDGNNN